MALQNSRSPYQTNANVDLQCFDIIVVGGGMIGAITAVALAREKFKVAVIEKNEPLDVITDEYSLRVSAIAPYGVQYLTNLDIWQHISSIRRCAKVNAMTVLQASDMNKTVKFKDFKNNEVAYIVENNLIQLAAWRELRQANNVSIFIADDWGNLNINQDFAQIRLADGISLRAKLLIGSDGQKSKLRTEVGIEYQVLPYQQICVAGIVKTEKSNANKCWQIYYQQGIFAFLNLTEFKSSIAWYMPQYKMKWLQQLSEDELLHNIQNSSHNLLGKIEKVYNWGAFPLVGGQAETYCANRVVLVGDAAHSIHPQAGQGLNLGLLDSAQLVEILVAKKNEDFGRLVVLNHYYHQRSLDNEILIRSMEHISAFFESQNLKFLRDIGMYALHKSELMTGIISRMAIAPRFGVPKPMQK